MYSVNFDISGQVAVITGAGGIICGTLAREMAKKGVKVALLDLFLENAEKITAEIVAAGGASVEDGVITGTMNYLVAGITWVNDPNAAE